MSARKDTRRFPFFMIDNRILDEEFEWLGFRGFTIYAFLVQRHYQTNGVLPSYNEIVDRFKVSRKIISRVIRDLEGNRLISVHKKPGKKSTYQLLDLTPYDYARSGDGRYVQLRPGVLSVVPLDQCPQGTTTSSPREPGVVPPGNHPRVATSRGFKDPTPTPGVGGGGIDGLDPKFERQHALLTHHGVNEPKATELAPLLPLAGLECVIAYWQNRAGGMKPVTPALLVRMVQHPEGFGVKETPAGWKHPPLPGERTSSPAAPAPPAKPLESRVSETHGRRRQLEAELARLRDDPGSLFNLKGKLSEIAKR